VVEPPRGRGLLDTSVVLGLGEVETLRLPPEMAISALTLAEVTSGPHAVDDELERARRQDRLQRIEADFESLSFDLHCARAFGQVYAAVRSIGRKARGPRMVDLMIAATAMAHDLPLYTLNAKDLRGLEDLVQVVDLTP